MKFSTKLDTSVYSFVKIDANDNDDSSWLLKINRKKIFFVAFNNKKHKKKNYNFIIKRYLKVD